MNISIHPWIFLKRELEKRSLSQKQLAYIIWKTPTEISYIIKGKRSLNSEWSIKLEIIFWISAIERISLQQSYDMYVFYKDEKNTKYINEIKERSYELLQS